MVSFSSMLKPRAIVGSLSRDAEKSTSLLPKNALSVDAAPKPSVASALKPKEMDVDAIPESKMKPVEPTKPTVSEAPGKSSSLASGLTKATTLGGVGLGLYQFAPALGGLLGGGGVGGVAGAASAAAQTAALAGAATVVGGDVVSGITTLGTDAIGATQSIFTDPMTVATIVGGVVAFYVLTAKK